MANQIQESILKSIDLLVNNRIDKIATDKTVTATIVRCTNSLKNEYKVSYNGGFMTAYAQNGAFYNDNATVYVLVPEGDFTKRKLIVDKATLSEEDNNITFMASALSDYNMIGRNVITDDKETLPIGLYSYLKEDYWLLYEHGQTGDETFTDFNKGVRGRISYNIDEFESYIQEAEALIVEASFQTRLPKTHRLSKTGNYGIQFNLAFKDGDATDEEGNAKVKYYSYVIDMNNMVGNPYQFTGWNDQYLILPIDVENFLYIESIVAFCQGFEPQDDKIQANLYGADIFIKDLEIYGLKKIAGASGDYRLTIGTPRGALFKTIQDIESLDIVAKTTYQVDQDLSDSTTYYWFKEDNRITSSSEDYQMYGGVGWKLLRDKGIGHTIVIYGNENRAYENRYKCVAVYKESVVLREEVVIYNDAARRNLSIVSDLGVKFSFDRGKPTLTCLVDGKSENFEEGKANPHEDDWFTFVWSKESVYDGTLIFNQTVEELQQLYDEAYASGTSFTELISLKNKIAALDGVEFEIGKNTLTYPTKLVDATATFKCNVYLKDSDASEDYSIGSASIVLQNEMAAIPEDYHIIIENGEQVFQYSESGVSPANERYTDPLEVKPLICHFYDPAGLEVNKETYSVKWMVPLDDTLIVAPKEGMTLNPASGLEDWCVSEVYPLAIEESYDSSAMLNQITCLVTYDGLQYSKDTNLYFGKIGDNGTNGTDIVAAISPTSTLSLLDGEMLALEFVDGIPRQWNTGQYLGDQVLDFDLYQRNEKVVYDSVSWSLTDKVDTYMSVYDGRISWDEIVKAKQRLQIVKATATLEGQSYYATYPIPTIDYQESVYGQQYHVAIDRDYTLKQILYNADGRNPQYNKNQGVKLRILETKKSSTPKYIIWKAEGGSNEDETSAAFDLIRKKNDNARKAQSRLVPEDVYDEDGRYQGWEELTQIYILPKDVYSGLYTNNRVHAIIYTNESVYFNGGNPEAEIYIPINCSLNRYGLASLNAWDGNHIEINEEENYILAPQIGAGKKDNDNSFTGVVMGEAVTYENDKPKSAVGLLGYSKGEQSIWLDAETGKAVFGLPENSGDNTNRYSEGRIELVPGGESKIGKWTLGSRALYNMKVPADYVGDVPAKPYKKYPVKNAQIAVPSAGSGVILNADPAYISVKGEQLDRSNSSIKWTENANLRLAEGDTLEVEVDPSKLSIFSIYRHTIENGDWTRYPLVGINSSGQFYSNAVQDGESAMGIGYIGAFGNTAEAENYVGSIFTYDEDGIIKFFVDYAEGQRNNKGTLYISGSNSTTSESIRPISLYGESLNLYADGRKSKTSDHRVSISSTDFFGGHNGESYFQASSSNGLTLFSSSSMNITANNWTEDIKYTKAVEAGTLTTTVDNSDSLTVGGNLTERVGGSFSLQSSGSVSSGIPYYSLDMNSGSVKLAVGQYSGGDRTSYLQLNKSSKSILTGYYGLQCNSYIGDININANSGGDVYVKANDETYLKLNKTAGVGTASSNGFTLTCSYGAVSTSASTTININASNKLPCVKITNGLMSGYGYFSGSLSGLEDGSSTFSILTAHGILAKGTVRGSNFIYVDGTSVKTVSRNTNSIDTAYKNGSFKIGDIGGDVNFTIYFTSVTEGIQQLLYLCKRLNERIERVKGLLNSYLKISDAQSTYLTKSSASDTYLTKSTYNSFKKTYNSHTHSVSCSKIGYGRYQLKDYDGKYYTDIDNGSWGKVVTSVDSDTGKPSS